jgi:hypothetical protein
VTTDDSGSNFGRNFGGDSSGDSGGDSGSDSGSDNSIPDEEKGDAMEVNSDSDEDMNGESTRRTGTRAKRNKVEC